MKNSSQPLSVEEKRGGSLQDVLLHDNQIIYTSVFLAKTGRAFWLK